MRRQPKPSLIDTAEFRKLVRIEQPDDGPGPDPAGRHDYSDDPLAKTDKLRKLELPELDGELEVDPGMDPYNSAMA